MSGPTISENAHVNPPAIFLDQESLLPQSPDATSEPVFTLYGKLPLELRMYIWNLHIQAHPRRIVLSVSPSRLIAIERKYPVPVQLQVSREVRDHAFSLNGYAELKRTGEDSGIIFHPEVDMLYLDEIYAEDCSAKCLKDTALRCQVLDKIRCIAISTSHTEFLKFIDSFRYYQNLELVFVVMKEGPQRRLWGVAEETRVSEQMEIMFKVIDTHAPLRDYRIPRIHIPSEKFERKHSNRLRGLYRRIARPGGVTPQIRFVRSVKCMVQG